MNGVTMKFEIEIHEEPFLRNNKYFITFERKIPLIWWMFSSGLIVEHCEGGLVKKHFDSRLEAIEFSRKYNPEYWNRTEKRKCVEYINKNKITVEF